MSEKQRGGRHFATPTGASEGGTGYIPVAEAHDRGEDGGRRSGRTRYHKAEVLESDPYDLKGYRTRRGSRAMRVVSNVLFAVGIALVLVAGGIYVHNQLDYRQQDESIQELQEMATVDDSGSEAPVVDWAALQAVNDDVVGWVQIPGTIVNYPVYQGASNETYLHTDAHGNYTIGGLIFEDYENAAPGLKDAQTIIYGHHLQNGAMFKPISDMDTQGMFDSVATVWFVTPEETYELEPLCVYYTTEDDLSVRTLNFASDEERQAYLAERVDKAVTKSADAAQVAAGAQHVLSLVTCNYVEEGQRGRTVLICVPKDEAAAARAGAQGGEAQDDAAVSAPAEDAS